LTNCTCNAGWTGPDGGTCTACVSGKYKVLTGSALCTDCGAETYSTTASSTCSTCPSNSNWPAGIIVWTNCVTVVPVGTAATYFVKMTLLFPLAESEFTVDKQMKLRESIAAAVGTKPADVTIEKFEIITGRRNFGRRLLSESVLVYIAVKASDAKEADGMAKSLTADKINKALENAGLPKATMKQAPTATYASASPTVGGSIDGGVPSFPQSKSASGGQESVAVIGGVVGTVVVCCTLASFRYLRRRILL
jgi:hypothetical protein